MAKKLSLVDQVANALILYIQNQNLKVGDRLPNEYKLVEDLQVSRSTVREAIKALSSQNILEVKRGAGTFISSKKGIADDPLGFKFVEDRLKLTCDLFEIRYLLEPTVAGLAAQNATDEEIAQLEVLVDKIEELIKKENPEHLILDQKFHELIANASGNIALSHLMPVINESIQLYDEFTSPRSKEETIIAHRDIINAIKERNSLQAQNAMLIHIIDNRRVLLRKVREVDAIAK